MIRKQATRSIRFLRTIAIGGIFFLLPLVVVGALVGQLIQVVWVAAGSVSDFIPSETPLGYAFLFLCGMGILILLCFAAGVIARWAIGKRFTELTEKYLLMLFPRYAIFKEQLSGNIGGYEFQNSLVPVLIECIDFRRVALEVERDVDGNVAVYLPGSPDPWSGTVIVVRADRVRPLGIEFADALALFEQLGRKTLSVMADRKLSQPISRSSNPGDRTP